MASRLGVMYVIYNRKIWSAYSPGWRDYTGADPHTSHIHISMSWNGARGHTSFWTGRLWDEDQGVCQVFANQPGVVPARKPRTKPCPEPAAVPRGSTQPLGWLGSGGTAVSQAQDLLGVPDTASFDRATRKAVLGYQKAHDLPRTGAMDDPTWASLMPSTARLNVPDWNPAKAARWAEKAGTPILHRGDAGKAVYALQVALRLEPSLRNGFYGPHTRDAVIAIKTAADLPATALVDAGVWSLLPADPAA
jgi:peptidoglycan hydrolase-like protein with peptidoglycan-binding domain